MPRRVRMQTVAEMSMIMAVGSRETMAVVWSLTKDIDPVGLEAGKFDFRPSL